MDPAEIIRVKELLPTTLGSDEIRSRYASDILRRSLFSAKTAYAGYLSKMRDVCASFAAGEINLAKARETLTGELLRLGLSPQDGGGIASLASARRLNLILRTQKQMAASVADIQGETEGTLHQFPAYELVRYGKRRVHRPDWAGRWQAAGDACGWKGAARNRMMALKGSPIWEKLGDGAGGFRDTLQNPYPPFAFGSGLSWRDVPRDEAIKEGLMTEEEEVKKQSATISPGDGEIKEAAKRLGFTEEDFK